jgi:phage shock protein C
MNQTPTYPTAANEPSFHQQASHQPPSQHQPPYQPSQHQPPYQPSGHQPPYRQLRRPVTDRMVAGVCSGLGRYLNVDPTLVRVIFAVAVLMTAGVALLAYPIMWFLMPEEPAGAPAWPTTGHVGPPPPPAPPAAPPVG